MTTEGWLALICLGLAGTGVSSTHPPMRPQALDCQPTSVGLTDGLAVCGGPARLPTRARAVLGLPVDLNEASEDDLVGLPGIGPTLAHRITEYRSRVGTIRNVAELENVSGIGPAHLRTLLGRVSVQERVAP